MGPFQNLKFKNCAVHLSWTVRNVGSSLNMGHMMYDVLIRMA